MLEDHGRDWHIYYDDTPQVWAFINLWNTPERHANWFAFSEFERHAREGTLPAYSFIEPNHRPVVHTVDHAPLVGEPDVSNSQHPGNSLISDGAYDAAPAELPGDFLRAEALIAQVYEALRANPELFNRTILLITYDEHGGLYDHVPPPTGVPNPGSDPTLLRRILRAIYRRKSAAFDFATLGPRVPAVVVSPYVEPGTVSTDTHDHASIPSTLRALFAADAHPLTSRDAWAAPFHQVLQRSTPRSGAELPDLAANRTSQPPVVPAASAGALAGPANPVAHFQPFIGLADDVRRVLTSQGVPEATLAPGTPARQRATQTTDAFHAQAERSRAN